MRGLPVWCSWSIERWSFHCKFLPDFVFSFFVRCGGIRSEETIAYLCPGSSMAIWTVNIFAFYGSGHVEFLLSDHEYEGAVGAALYVSHAGSLSLHSRPNLLSRNTKPRMTGPWAYRS